MDFHTVGAPAPASAAWLGGETALPPAWRTPCLQCPVRALCFFGGEGAARLPDTLVVGRRRLGPGELLQAGGSAAASVYVVRSGTLKSSVHTADGREQVTAFHLPGELVGLEVLANGRASCATALENAEVCGVPHSELARGVAGTRGPRDRLWARLSGEIVRRQRDMLLLALGTAEERVAAFLLDVSRRMQERGYSPREFHLRMSRADIGSYLGLTLETVSRTLSSFAQQRMIEVRKRHIRILAPHELAHQGALGLAS